MSAPSYHERLRDAYGSSITDVGAAAAEEEPLTSTEQQTAKKTTPKKRYFIKAVGVIVIILFIAVIALCAIARSHRVQRHVLASHGIYDASSHPHAPIVYDDVQFTGVPYNTKIRFTNLRIASQSKPPEKLVHQDEITHVKEGYRNGTHVKFGTIGTSISLMPFLTVVVPMMHTHVYLPESEMRNGAVVPVHMDRFGRAMEWCTLVSNYTDSETNTISWSRVRSYFDSLGPVGHPEPAATSATTPSQNKTRAPMSWPLEGVPDVRIPAIHIDNVTLQYACTADGHVPIHADIGVQIAPNGESVSVYGAADVPWTSDLHNMTTHWLRQVDALERDNVRISFRAETTEAKRDIDLQADVTSPIGLVSTHTNVPWKAVVTWAQRNKTEIASLFAGFTHWSPASLVHPDARKIHQTQLLEEAPGEVAHQITHTPLVAPVHFTVEASCNVRYIDAAWRLLRPQSSKVTIPVKPRPISPDRHELFENAVHVDIKFDTDGTLVVDRLDVETLVQNITTQVVVRPLALAQTQLHIAFGGFVKGRLDVARMVGEWNLITDAQDHARDSTSRITFHGIVDGLNTPMGVVKVHDIALRIHDQTVCSGTVNADIRTGNVDVNMTGIDMFTITMEASIKNFHMQHVYMRLHSSHATIKTFDIRYRLLDTTLRWDKGGNAVWEFEFHDLDQRQAPKLAGASQWLLSGRTRVVFISRHKVSSEVQFNVTRRALDAPDVVVLTTSVDGEVHVSGNEIYMPQSIETKFKADIDLPAHHVRYSTPAGHDSYTAIMLYGDDRLLPAIDINAALVNVDSDTRGVWEIKYIHTIETAGVAHDAMVRAQQHWYGADVDFEWSMSLADKDPTAWGVSRIPPLATLINSKAPGSITVRNIRIERKHKTFKRMHMDWGSLSHMRIRRLTFTSDYDVLFFGRYFDLWGEFFVHFANAQKWKAYYVLHPIATARGLGLDHDIDVYQPQQWWETLHKRAQMCQKNSTTGLVARSIIASEIMPADLWCATDDVVGTMWTRALRQLFLKSDALGS